MMKIGDEIERGELLDEAERMHAAEVQEVVDVDGRSCRIIDFLGNRWDFTESRQGVFMLVGAPLP